MGTRTNRRAQLGRRETMGLLGAMGVVAATGWRNQSSDDGATTTTTPGGVDGCQLTPEQVEGPFYVDEAMVRSDITEGAAGVPLELQMTVVDSTTCAPIEGAAVDIWQADAAGTYSGFDSEDTSGETFLRGVQFSDADGMVQFTSIAPGWYQGRVNHIHVKVHLDASEDGDTFTGGTVSHTGQMYFPDEVNDAIADDEAYTDNPYERLTNDQDFIYNWWSGDESMLTTTGSVSEGFTGTVTLVVDSGAEPDDGAEPEESGGLGQLQQRFWRWLLGL